MHRSRLSIPLAASLALAALAAPGVAQDASLAITDGGIFVTGWQGKVDAREAQAGLELDDAKLTATGNVLNVATGPAISYWNPTNRATGDYTVKATFTEPKYMNRNNHPHPYGIFIGGNDLGGDQQSYLYCAAYGNGNFIVRGFGPAPFQLNGPRGGAHAAVQKAAGPGQPVTQEIAISVRGDQVSCTINGQVVGSYPKADVVATGRLKSTDGIYGIRFGHNTEATVTALTLTKP